jgi:dTDP-4-dehydrorhamnose 3,5-epimerase/reductase
VFAAWVDLREGPAFGTVVHRELGPETAVFVPRGLGNSYQALADGTAYTYLVNDHWRPDRGYLAVDPGDPDLAIPWPIPLADAELSEKDRAAPALREVSPIRAEPGVLVLGAHGQLGRALMEAFPGARGVGRDELDLGDAAAVAAWPWGDVDVVLNAAAYTAVDAAETPEGRRAAWAVNAVAVARLAREAERHRLTLVHYSTDYVFDGEDAGPDGYREDDPVAPLGCYGQSKAAGDQAVGAVPRHYLLRTSWVIGDGHNFVRTMADLAARGVSPQVVDDQLGRLTFTSELARATRHLLDTDAPPGTYHVTGDGPETTWYAVARRVFELSGRNPDDVSPVSTEAYLAGRKSAPRPLRSTLDLSRIAATGFVGEDPDLLLHRYLAT